VLVLVDRLMRRYLGTYVDDEEEAGCHGDDVTTSTNMADVNKHGDHVVPQHGVVVTNKTSKKKRSYEEVDDGFVDVSPVTDTEHGNISQNPLHRIIEHHAMVHRDSLPYNSSLSGSALAPSSGELFSRNDPLYEWLCGGNKEMDSFKPLDNNNNNNNNNNKEMDSFKPLDNRTTVRFSITTDDVEGGACCGGDEDVDVVRSCPATPCNNNNKNNNDDGSCSLLQMKWKKYTKYAGNPTPPQLGVEMETLRRTQHDLSTDN